ncbi:MAG TPA: hypothetical protein VFC19_09765 [Candidatus Limnocylindrales bacterium]|nr:hypothetical protein [Candidatus Limnocylindrales bacterium]
MGAQHRRPALQRGCGIGELNIRGPAHEAFALAVSLRLGVYDPATAGVNADVARARAVRLVQSLAMRHLSNSDNGWGGGWQSALWTSFTAWAGWLLWEDLGALDRERLGRMLEYEADRFNGYVVPYYRDEAGNYAGSVNDTKAEENAWSAMVLQVATAMLPGHRRFGQWMNKAAELEISAFSRPVDVSSTAVVNGRTVGQWLRGSNINNDGFVINHGFVHPDYSTTVSENIFAALAYSMAWRATPRAAFWGAQYVYRALVDHPWVAGTMYPPRGVVLQPAARSMTTTRRTCTTRRATTGVRPGASSPCCSTCRRGRSVSMRSRP